MNLPSAILLRCAASLLIAWTSACSSFSTSNRALTDRRIAGQLYYLPQGKIRITGEWKNPGSHAQSLFVVIISEELEADPTARYYLKPDANIFYDNETALTVNAKGLLTTADATSEDRTHAIVATAANIATDALEFNATGGAGGIAMQAVAEGKPQCRPFNFVFDPADGNEKNRIAHRIATCGFGLKVIEQESIGVPLPSQWPAGADILAQGVVFRPLKPWRVIVDSTNDSVAALRESKLLHLPDKAHPLVLDYARVPFVKKATSVTFVDGTLRDYSRKVPSPVFGFLGIPQALLGAVAPLPLQLKQTQITNLRADETLRKLRAPTTPSQ